MGCQQDPPSRAGGDRQLSEHLLSRSCWHSQCSAWMEWGVCHLFAAAAVTSRANWGEKQSKAGAMQDSWALWIWEDHPCYCGNCSRTLQPISLPT